MDAWNKLISELQKDTKIPETVNKRIDQTLSDLKETGNQKADHFAWHKVAIAACAVIVCGTFVLSNPTALAKLPVIGHIFERVEKKTNFAINPKDSNVLKNGQESVLTATDQGIDVTASEVYSDGLSVFTTFKITSSKIDFRNMKKSTDGEYTLSSVATYGFDESTGKQDTDLPIFGDVSDAHTFIGIAKFNKPGQSYDKGMIYLNLSEFMPYLKDTEDFKVTGDWHLKIPFTTDRKGSKEIHVNKTFHAKDNTGKTSDFIIKKIFLSRYQAVLCYQQSDYPDAIATMRVFNQEEKPLLFQDSWGDKENGYNCSSFLTKGKDITKLNIFALAERGEDVQISEKDFLKFVETKSMDVAKKYADFSYIENIQK